MSDTPVEKPTPVTYKHAIANSTVHLQNHAARTNPDQPESAPLKTVTFSGKPGGVGYYTTKEAWEQRELDYLANHPQVQVSREKAPLLDVLDSPQAQQVEKVEDPAVAVAHSEVTEVAVRNQNPAVIAAQANLAKAIAANKPN